jgi:hypothetical protein
VPPSVPGSQHTPLPHPLVPAIDWTQYFSSFEGVLAALNADHAMAPKFLGIMLTGLQSLLRDQHYLSLQVDSGFYLFIYLFNGIYFNIDLKGDLNRSLAFTSPGYLLVFTGTQTEQTEHGT